jgi:hypothetical protein
MKNKIIIIGLLGIAFFGLLSFSHSNIERIQTVPGSYVVDVAPLVQQRDNTNTSRQIQIALILDTSNSMDGLIDQAKSQLWKIVNELASATKDSMPAQISIALYEYGNQEIAITENYVRQVLPFTSDLDDISEKLFSLNTNGGDEYCGQAINTSLNELGWDEGNEAGMKLIYIAGNEAFTQGSFSHRKACELASKNNVVIHPIFCGDRNQGKLLSWNDCALITGGEYLNINSDLKTIAVATPYDDQIDQLNVQLNNTYIHYGSSGKESKQKQITEDGNQLKYSKANKISRTLSKSSNVYYNGKWDLVDAYSGNKEIVKEIEKTTLPDSIQALSTADLQDFVIEKSNERIAINSKIAELGAERARYITKAKISSSEKSLGDEMIKTIRTEATKNGFKLKN